MAAPPPLGAKALLDISSKPTARDVDELIMTQIAARWNRVALKLGVQDFVIDNISVDNPNSCERACQDMLKRWLKGDRHTGKEKRTWSTLLTALGSAGYIHLERSLRKEHFQDSPTLP